jgi:hypothetical protein
MANGSVKKEKQYFSYAPVKDKVDFECRVCGMTIKKDEPMVQATGPRSDTLYYSHSKHGKDENAE